MIADVFITTKDRPHLLQKSLESFRGNTERSLYRLTVVCDGPYPENRRVLDDFEDIVDHVLIHRENMGLGPSINQALSHIKALNDWDSGAYGDPKRVSALICYCQDDLLYTKGWLSQLSARFLLHESHHRLAFATGLECVEHPVRKLMGGGTMLKDHIRAAQMLGRTERWLSMYPITKYDPETGNIRAKPNDGVGSGVDWWFIRNHELSVCKTGQTCLVVPGLVKHLGYDQSTWLKRELPESDADKCVVNAAMEPWRPICTRELCAEVCVPNESVCSYHLRNP